MKERITCLQEKACQFLQDIRPDRLVERFRNASRIDKIRAGVFIAGTTLSAGLAVFGIRQERENDQIFWVAIGADTELVTFAVVNPFNQRFLRGLLDIRDYVNTKAITEVQQQGQSDCYRDCPFFSNRNDITSK